MSEYEYRVGTCETPDDDRPDYGVELPTSLDDAIELKQGIIEENEGDPYHDVWIERRPVPRWERLADA